MGSTSDRVSGIFFLVLGLAMYFYVIPNYVEHVDEGNIAPATLPNIISLILALCGAILALKPTDFQMRDPALMTKTGLYVLVLVTGLWAMSWFGFEYVAPVLAFAIMWLIGERRPLWLVLGVIAVPTFIWFLVTFALGRSLP